MPDSSLASGRGQAVDEVRLLLLCAGDPEDERPFSGSARSLFRALDRRGCVHCKGNVAGVLDPFARGPLAVRVFRRLDRFGIEERYRWTRAAFAANSKRAEHIAQSHPGFNACLMYGTTYLPKPGVPAYCYFDATAAQVYGARAWEFASFSEAKAQDIIAYQREVFEACAGIFPRTRWAAESVVRDYGIPEAKVVVAGAGPNYYAEPLPHGPYDSRSILFIGSEFERKGGPLIVDAFRRVRSVCPGARLMIAGCTPDISEPGVEVIGRIRKDAPGGLEKLLRLYGEASVFCMMSRFEPFGIVVIEAQNSFVPCVLPKRFAFPEMIDDGVTGRLVDEYEPELLAETLIDLLADPARLEQMGQAAHAYVRGKFTWDIAAARIHDRVRSDLLRGLP